MGNATRNNVYGGKVMEKKYLFTDFVFADILEYIPIWKWQELQMGVLEKFLSKSDVIRYATFSLEENMKNYNDVLNLVVMGDDVTFDYLLSKLSAEETLISDSKIINKWRYAMLFQLYLEKDKYEKVYIL